MSESLVPTRQPSERARTPKKLGPGFIPLPNSLSERLDVPASPPSTSRSGAGVRRRSTSRSPSKGTPLSESGLTDLGADNDEPRSASRQPIFRDDLEPLMSSDSEIEDPRDKQDKGFKVTGAAANRRPLSSLSPRVSPRATTAHATEESLRRESLRSPSTSSCPPGNRKRPSEAASSQEDEVWKDAARLRTVKRAKSGDADRSQSKVWSFYRQGKPLSKDDKMAHGITSPLQYFDWYCILCEAQAQQEERQARVTHRAPLNNCTNLRGHLTGNKRKNPCPNRSHAARLGLHDDLPPLHDQHRSESEQNAVQKVAEESRAFPYRRQVFNQLLTIHLVLKARHFGTYECEALEAAFFELNSEAHPQRRTSLKMRVEELYVDLEAVVMKEIIECGARISISYDDWTLKSQVMSIGAALATYITPDWKFRCRALFAKAIKGHHYGRALAEQLGRRLNHLGVLQKVNALTTDSASNNYVMARTLADIAKAEFEPSNEPLAAFKGSPAHVLCISHKFNLAASRFYRALDQHIHVDTKRWAPEDAPEISITDEAGDVQHFVDDAHEGTADGTQDPAVDENAEPLEISNALKRALADEQERESYTIVARLRELTVIVNGSDYRRQDFAKACESVGLKSKSLVSVNGVRWANRHQINQRALELRYGIERYLNDADDPAVAHLRFKTRGWKALEVINDIGDIFARQIHESEVEGPTGCLILQTYHRLRSAIALKRALVKESHPALAIAISEADMWLGRYEQEALRTDLVLILAVLYPPHRLLWLDMYHPEHATRARSLFIELFEKYKSAHDPEWPANRSRNDIAEAEDLDWQKMWGSSSQTQSDTGPDPELARWLNPTIEERADMRVVRSSHDILAFFKRYESHYPIISRMARDHVGTMMSNGSVERLFSSLADICTPDRMSLRAESINMLATAQHWLKSGITAPEGYEAAFARMAEIRERRAAASAGE